MATRGVNSATMSDCTLFPFIDLLHSFFLFFFYPSGDVRWTVVTSDISNAEENRENLIFCDFLPAKWYQLRISATNDAAKTTEHYHFSTTNLDGSTIAPPSVFPTENDLMNNLINVTNPTSGDWLATFIVVVIITLSIMTM